MKIKFNTAIILVYLSDVINLHMSHVNPFIVWLMPLSAIQMLLFLSDTGVLLVTSIRLTLNFYFIVGSKLYELSDLLVFGVVADHLILCPVQCYNTLVLLQDSRTISIEVLANILLKQSLFFFLDIE